MNVLLTNVRSDFIQIFSPCLRDIKKLMRSQLIRAREANHDVKVNFCLTNFLILC
jgi:hypothetical protein